MLKAKPTESIRSVIFVTLALSLVCQMALTAVYIEPALAEGAFRWKDSAGREHFGSNPPPDAVDIRTLKGKSFSRYSSNKLLQPYQRMSLSTDALEKKLDNSKVAPPKAGSMPPQPELPPIGEENLVSPVSQGEVTVTHDEKFRVTSCKVQLKNTGSLPVSDLIVSFEFEDGSLIPAVGPETVDGDSEATFEIPADLLPVSIKGAEDRAEAPRPKVNVQAGHQ